MSVFKKITSFLFEESEEDVIVEDELTNIRIQEQPKEKEAVQIPEEQPKVVYASHIEKKQPVVEEKKFVSINLHEEAEKPVRKEMEQLPKTIRVKSIKLEEKKDFEFTPVISPMFGAKDEEKKQEKPKKVTVSAPLASRKSKKKENPLGTIISPYFGMDEEEVVVSEEKEVEINNTIDTKQNEVVEDTNIQEDSVFKQVEHQEKEEMHDEGYDEVYNEETPTLTLEEMLLGGSKREIKEETLQISLFGNHAPIQREKMVIDQDEE